MARPDPAALLPLAESITDGSPVDWEQAETNATPEERAIIRELRVLANLAALHRSMPAVDGALPATSAPRHAATAPAIGRWAHLDLIERLGGGTFGEVYRAWDRNLEREVALKLLRTNDDDGQHLTASRIVNEGRRLARVQHPNVVTVYGVAMHEGRVGLWMELVHGATLEQTLAQYGSFSAGEAALVGIDVCRALAAIHQAGLIHRDVKTQNVMREQGGRIVLMDLGTSRGVEQPPPSLVPELAGTPLYLAPEIFAGTPASERTDLYSVGVLLYRLVTGAFPVRAATPDELREAHARRKIVRLRDARPDLPTPFVRIVDRAIAPDPGERYTSAGELEADLAASTDSSTTLLPKSAATAATRRPRIAWIVAAIVAAGAVVTVIAVPWIARRGTPADVVAPGVIRSLAVLPLANVSGDSAQDYFADGMTDELIDTLGRFGSLKVTSRTSVMRLKGTQQPLPEIARMLNADAVLEGSVLLVPGRKGNNTKPDRVRINARLILAGTDTQVWSDTFERVLSDVLLLQKEVAEAVARAVRVHVGETHAARVTAQSPEAEEAYLQGRFHMNIGSRADLETAQQYFERATMLAPTYAQAHAALAMCLIWREIAGDLSTPDARTMSQYASTTALQLDPNLADAHAALGDIKLYYDWDWKAAGDAYLRALDINPSYSYARSHYARYLAARDRMDEALAEARRAQEADPLSVEAHGVVALTLYYSRRYDEAIEEFKRALALGPSSLAERAGLSRAYAAKGAFPEAIAEMSEVVRLSGNAVAPVAALATLYAAAGRRADALATLENLRRDVRVPLPAQQAAYVYAALGDRAAAFEALDAAVRQRASGILWARVDPRLDPLRGDPRFADLLRRIGTAP